MAFDPIQEDCLRLILQTMRRQNIYPLENAEVIEQLMNEYAQNPDKLVVSDQDRSFHLLARAVELSDYRAAMLPDGDDEVDRLEDQAEAYLREAVELDPKNWDAQRMLVGICADSNDEYVSYLLDNREAVEADLSALIRSAQDPYEKEYASDLAVRPYLRWLAAITSHAFIGGQYRLVLAVAQESLEIEPLDPAGVRYTALLAMSKLEYSVADIKKFHTKHARAFGQQQTRQRRGEREQMRQDAWSLLAQLNVLYRQFDYEGASHVLRLLLRTYPSSAQALFYQPEFPEGLYGRVNVEPGSPDELILALSEATPILQEGLGAPDCACLATWISNHSLVQEALEREDSQMRASMLKRSSKGGN